MNTFKPTYLYVKTHNITGLKYFGKTTSNDPHKYKGSGKYWVRHIKKHGYDVTTEVIGLFTDEIWLQLYALGFSDINNITESKEWANLKEENGVDGGWEHINKNPTEEIKAQRIINGKRLGKQGYTTNKENCTGCFDSELQRRRSKLGNEKLKLLCKGAIWGLMKEERDKNRELSWSPEARAKHSKTAQENGSYKGERNSQHNTKFIYHSMLMVSFRVKYELVPLYIDQGWNLGKFSNEFFSNGKRNKSYNP